MNQFSRTELTFGKENMKTLSDSRVIVFGIGGVGGHTVEALVRSGIGAIDLVDNDTVSLTNLNRQILALHSTLGKNKTEVAAERIKDINPDCKVTVFNLFYLPETADQIDLSKYDYIIDCIDTISGKLEIICRAKKYGIPVISSMGAGNKVDPTQFHVADISKTSVCPLARVIRNELKKRKIKGLKCVFSTEKIIPPVQTDSALQENSKKPVPGSNAFVPSVAGLIIAAEVVKDLCNFHKTNPA